PEQLPHLRSPSVAEVLRPCQASCRYFTPAHQSHSALTEDKMQSLKAHDRSDSDPRCLNGSWLRTLQTHSCARIAFRAPTSLGTHEQGRRGIWCRGMERGNPKCPCQQSPGRGRLTSVQ